MLASFSTAKAVNITGAKGAGFVDFVNDMGHSIIKHIVRGEFTESAKLTSILRRGYSYERMFKKGCFAPFRKHLNRWNRLISFARCADEFCAWEPP